MAEPATRYPRSQSAREIVPTIDLTDVTLTTPARECDSSRATLLHGLPDLTRVVYLASSRCRPVNDEFLPRAPRRASAGPAGPQSETLRRLPAPRRRRP